MAECRAGEPARDRTDLPARRRSRPSERDLAGGGADTQRGREDRRSWPVSVRAVPVRLIEQVADRLGAPVIKTLSGKMVLADDSPYTTGGIGLLGTAPNADLVDDIDTLLMLGTNFPYTKHLPAPGKVKVVQVEIDATRVGNRLPTDVPLVGDVSATLEALLPHLRRNDDRGHLEKYQKQMTDWRDEDGCTRVDRRGTRSHRSTW